MNKKVIPEWKLIGHNHQIADTGDYDGCYEITNGKISIFTKHDDDDALEPIVTALNNANCKFHLDDSMEVELYLAKEDLKMQKELNRKMKLMIDNGLGWEDLKNDITYPRT